MTRDFQAQRLIVHDRLEEYDGTTAVVRTRSLDAEDVEFLRWRAERWMKLARRAERRALWEDLESTPAPLRRDRQTAA